MVEKIMMKAYPYLSINMDKPSYVGGYYSQTGKTIKDSVHIEFPESIGKSAIIQKTSTAFDNIEKKWNNLPYTFFFRIRIRTK